MVDLGDFVVVVVELGDFVVVVVDLDDLAVVVDVEVEGDELELLPDACWSCWSSPCRDVTSVP